MDWSDFLKTWISPCYNKTQILSLKIILKPLKLNLTHWGREVVINKKEKKNQTNVESAFLKDDTAIYNMQFRTERNIKIKIEVDINPPSGFTTEHKFFIAPILFYGPLLYLARPVCRGRCMLCFSEVGKTG